VTDNLTSFLASWLDWATTGAPQSKPYLRGHGLCASCSNFATRMELQDLLRAEFGEPNVPFSGLEQYLLRARADTQHECAPRLDWVRKQLAKVETHRGWSIGDCWYGYEATHPDYDPTPVYADDGPSDNRVVTATTRAGLIVEIDNWLAEQ
jgi:hypothetical protein